jgi:hypothetical protein
MYAVAPIAASPSTRLTRKGPPIFAPESSYAFFQTALEN